MMQVQGTQFAQALTSINQSLQELARGQSQMILMNQANREMTEAAQELLMQTQGAMPMEEDQWSTVATEVSGTHWSPTTNETDDPDSEDNPNRLSPTRE